MEVGGIRRVFVTTEAQRHGDGIGFSQLTARGYRFVSLQHALQDPAYTRRDEYVGPAGITWLHRWALTEGKKGAFFAGEPVVPEWVLGIK